MLVGQDSKLKYIIFASINGSNNQYTHEFIGKPSIQSYKNPLGVKVSELQEVRSGLSAELIVPYKDLKNNFPYALIDFYESKMKMATGNDQTAQIQDFQETKANKNSKIKAFDARQSNKYCQKKAESEKPSKILLEGHEEEDKNESAELIFDYDKYLHDNVHSFKHFHSLFSDFEPVQNRYLKDLRNEAKEYGRKGGKEEVLEFKRKKARIDYSEE